MYRRQMQRSATQALGYLHGMESLYNPLTSNFEDGKNIQFILSRPTFVDSSDRDRSESPGKSTMGHRIEASRKCNAVKPSSFQHVLLQHKRLLSLLSYLRHYNRHFAFTHGNSTHPTLNFREDIYRQKLLVTKYTFTVAKWQLSL